MKHDKLEDLDASARVDLAKLVGTSEAVVRQIATRRRRASSGMAIRIEKAAEKLGLLIPRSDLASACATCEYARACERSKGKK